jgi:septum formation protein
MKIILASTSPYRRALLSKLGVNFSCESPGVDEDTYRHLAPTDLAATLAREKARAVFARHPEALVIGGDQVAEVDGTALGKPGDAASAVAQLHSLRGKAHYLRTALHVCAPGQERFHMESVTLTMPHWDEDTLRKYVELDKPFDCAGSYKIEAHGIGLFTSIETQDWSAIEGVPLLWLHGVLREAGVSVFRVQ